MWMQSLLERTEQEIRWSVASDVLVAKLTVDWVEADQLVFCSLIKRKMVM